MLGYIHVGMGDTGICGSGMIPGEAKLKFYLYRSKLIFHLELMNDTYLHEHLVFDIVVFKRSRRANTSCMCISFDSCNFQLVFAGFIYWLVLTGLAALLGRE